MAEPQSWHRLVYILTYTPIPNWFKKTFCMENQSVSSTQWAKKNTPFYFEITSCGCYTQFLSEWKLKQGKFIPYQICYTSILFKVSYLKFLESVISLVYCRNVNMPESSIQQYSTGLAKKRRLSALNWSLFHYY
jgi:hypothetical protein